MKKTNTVLLIIITILLLFVIYFYIITADFSPKDDKLLQKINGLELKIDSINNKKDSIRTVIDSTHVKIVTNEKHYQERINTILVQSASSDSGFISNYIRQYSSKNALSNIE